MVTVNVTKKDLAGRVKLSRRCKKNRTEVSGAKNIFALRMISIYYVVMLLELKIENFGIIEELRVRPGPGLNVITGETGSGKSLVLTALDTVLGARAGAGLVRVGSHRAAVEALFDITHLGTVRDLLRDRGIGLPDAYLELRRDISPDGRGRAYINGGATTLAVVRALAPHLLEVHGQHEHQRILDPEQHLDSLDLFAGTYELRDATAELYHRYNHLRNRLRSVTLEADERERRLDYLRFALDDIEGFEPKAGEFEELQQEKALIQNSGRLFQDLCAAYSALREEDHSVLDRLSTVTDLLERHAHLLKGIEEHLSPLNESVYTLESLGDYLRGQKDRLQFSPERLEDIEERLAGYQRLHKKYGGNTDAVLSQQERFLRELSSIEMTAEELEHLRSDLQVTAGELYEKAEDLSRRRRSVVSHLEDQIAEELTQLGMPGARIKVQVRREVDPDAGEEANRPQRYTIQEKGIDRVEFFLAANTGEALQPLRKVASGGELSRITLALKSIFFAQRPSGTVVFDEVDAGVGGEVAHTIGNRLKRLAGQSQVLVVTHLHQIASMADRHFSIWKRTTSGRTTTGVQRLQGEARLKEMARMLGGESSGKVVLEHARELLNRNRSVAS